MSSPASGVAATAVSVQSVLGMREEYRRELACQIVHDSWHARGFTTSFLLTMDGEVAGYGSVGGAPREPRETVKEFFLFPHFRGLALPLFRALCEASGARRVEAQTNDPLLLLMLFDVAVEVTSPTILFADGSATDLRQPGVDFRLLSEEERRGAFPHTHEPVGEYGLVCDGGIVATGGLAFHYNPPYADLYMEVAAPARRRGLGSYLVQELKRACYQQGYIPAARCDAANEASRRTLQRAGMFPCGRIVQGGIRAPGGEPVA